MLIVYKSFKISYVNLTMILFTINLTNNSFANVLYLLICLNINKSFKNMFCKFFPNISTFSRTNEVTWWPPVACFMELCLTKVLTDSGARRFCFMRIFSWGRNGPTHSPLIYLLCVWVLTVDMRWWSQEVFIFLTFPPSFRCWHLNPDGSW